MLHRLATCMPQWETNLTWYCLESFVTIEHNSLSCYKVLNHIKLFKEKFVFKVTFIIANEGCGFEHCLCIFVCPTTYLYYLYIFVCFVLLEKCLKSATPSGYSFISVPRKSGRGGGIVLIYKSSIRVRLKPSLNNDSFESMLAEVVYDHIQMGMVLVYRPPSENFSTFLTEFGQMVTPLLIENSSRILCLGDFNIHVDQESDLQAKVFNSLLSEIGLLQHVCFPTHEKGHTLDLVLTDVRHPPLIREPGPTLQGYVQSDHYPLCFDITCPKPHKPSKIIQFRKWSNLDLEHFKSKLSSSLADSTATSDVNTMVDVYNQTLKSCLDDLLPIRSKTITEHFNCPYYNDEIRAAKQCRCKLERQWRKSRSDHHRALYVNQCKFVTTLLKRAKAEYYQTKVIECKKDQKALFRVLN